MCEHTRALVSENFVAEKVFFLVQASFNVRAAVPVMAVRSISGTSAMQKGNSNETCCDNTAIESDMTFRCCSGLVPQGIEGLQAYSRKLSDIYHQLCMSVTK